MKKLVCYLSLVLCCMLTFTGCQNRTTSASTKPLSIPILKRDMTVGVGILSDYESNDKVIFHGYFGIFVYDLKTEEITLAVDLEKTVGINQIQGTPYVNVVVNEDGSEIILYLDDTTKEDETMAYYINTLDGSYMYEAYKPFNKSAEYGNVQKYSGNVVEDISYTNGEQIWKIFENWEFE